MKETYVYNLTLDVDNVYYANKVLVSNCADSVMMAIFALSRYYGLGKNGFDNKVKNVLKRKDGAKRNFVA